MALSNRSMRFLSATVFLTYFSLFVTKAHRLVLFMAELRFLSTWAEVSKWHRRLNYFSSTLEPSYSYHFCAKMIKITKLFDKWTFLFSAWQVLSLKFTMVKFQNKQCHVHIRSSYLNIITMDKMCLLNTIQCQMGSCKVKGQ